MSNTITRENYREYDAINYSKLKALSEHPSKVQEEMEPSAGMINGDILDMFCYDGEDKVHDKYHISTNNKIPSESILEIIHTAPDYESDTLVETARQLEYGGKNWGDDTILRRIMEDGANYIEELQQAGDKPVIDFEVFSQMQQACRLLKNHPFTSDFFTSEWKNQVPLTANLPIEEGNALFKCLLDGYKDSGDYIDVHDLKFTSRRLSGFAGQFWKMCYYIQASLYTAITFINLQKPVRYHNVVYSSSENKVQTFRIDSSIIKMGREGGTSYTGKQIKGYQTLAKELIWHQNSNRWDYPYDIYRNNGVQLIEFHES